MGGPSDNIVSDTYTGAHTALTPLSPLFMCYAKHTKTKKKGARGLDSYEYFTTDWARAAV